MKTDPVFVTSKNEETVTVYTCVDMDEARIVAINACACGEQRVFIRTRLPQNIASRYHARNKDTHPEWYAPGRFAAQAAPVKRKNVATIVERDGGFAVNLGPGRWLMDGWGPFGGGAPGLWPTKEAALAAAKTLSKRSWCIADEAGEPVELVKPRKVNVITAWLELQDKAKEDQ